MNAAPISGKQYDLTPIISPRHDSSLVYAASTQQRLEFGAKHSFGHIKTPKRWQNKPERVALSHNLLPLVFRRLSWQGLILITTVIVLLASCPCHLVTW